MTDYIRALTLASVLILGYPAQAHEHASDDAHVHSGKRGHAHTHGSDHSVYEGYFEDSQVEWRELSDWEGEWQSVYPYLEDGTLDPVMAHKAEHGDKTAEEYRAYYET